VSCDAFLILLHALSPFALTDKIQGSLKYKVKWEGYEKKSDQTWEEENNLRCVVGSYPLRHVWYIVFRSALLTWWSPQRECSGSSR
jgi:hypothetical protein